MKSREHLPRQARRRHDGHAYHARLMSHLVPDQSWHNPKSRWRRRVWMMWFALAAPGVVVTLIGLYAVYETLRMDWAVSSPGMTPGGLDWDDYLFVAIMLAITGVTGVTLIVLGQRERAIAKRVVTHDGRLCPGCHRSMVSMDNHQRRLRCEGCGVTLDLDEVRQYWVNRWLNRMGAWAWLSRNRLRRWKGRALETLWGPTLEDPRVRPGWMALMLLSAAACTAFFAMIMHLVHAIALGALIGMTQAVMAWHSTRQARRPSVRGRFCAQCDYQLPPPPNEAERCAECGADWTKPGGFYTGVRATSSSPSRHLLPAAAMILFFGAYIVVMPFGPLGNRLLSTNMLVGAVTRTGDVFIYSEWKELLDRPLNDEQRVTLARGLLQRREARETLERDANEWFEREIEAGTLPPEIVREYQAGVVVLNVQVPQQARLGEEVPIRIETLKRYERPAPFTSGIAIIFGGFETGGDQPPIGRTEKPVTVSTFGSTTIMYGRRDLPHARDRGSIGSFTPREPGEMTLRARYWLLLYPGNLPRDPIVWNDDGTPVLPPDAVWTVECVVERIIEVIE